jgi:hypothetical protein
MRRLVSAELRSLIPALSTVALCALPADEQKKIAAGKLEAFRIAGMVRAIQKSQAVTTIPTTVN